MSCKPLTKKEWEASVAETFSACVKATYQDLIDAAVKAEREACAELRNMFHPIDGNGRQEIIDVMNRGLDEYQAAIRARGQA
jgi:hypothetical protein